MEGNILDRLFASFTELESAITKARATLSQRDSVPESVMKRLQSYDSILIKQRELASNLCSAISNKDWDEVTRHVSLINGLSAMIRDDAKAILQAISTNDPQLILEQETENFC